jgi:ribosomal protein S18 acetylase RimI-like enzyme
LNTTQVHTVIRAERPKAVETLVRAFQDDILKRTLAPELKNREPFTRWIYNGVVRYCSRYGLIQATDRVEGVACWLPPGKTTLSLWGMYTSWNMIPGPFVVAGRAVIDRFYRMQDVVDREHKRLVPRPHWYLWALAVRPENQGQGLGGQLLRPILEQADAGEMPVYLETQTEQNVRFYTRRGFDVIHFAEIEGLRLWFMVREPGKNGQAT